MKFGISLAGLYDLPNYPKESVRLAQLIESLGFDSVWTGDSQMLHRDAYCELALWASKTKKIKLGPCVTNPYTRHASVTASAIMTINEISHGRALLGMGLGDSSVRRIGLRPRALVELKESVSIVRDLTRGKPVNFEGQLLRIRWGKPRKIPIFIAASGPKSLELAGEIGDGVIMHAGPSEEGVKFAISRVEKGLKKAKRKRQHLELIQFLFASVAPSRSEAVKRAKPFVTWYLVNLPKHPIVKQDKLSSIVAKKILAYRRNYYRYDEESSHHSADWDSSVKKSEFITDELVDKYALAGTPEAIVDKLRLLEATGIDHIIFRPPFTARFQESLRLLGNAINRLK
jgi:5,10-methylenetetrahydromethanopterin reductase